jgi:ribosomal protein S12 methylthiotransferase
MVVDKKILSQGNKISFTSLGCPRNLVDSEVMLGILLQAGYEITPEVEDADYLVVNTCGFLQAAREEGKDVIKELFEYKKPNAKIIATGCMVQKHKDELSNTFPDIHYYLGSGDVNSILEAIEGGKSGESISSKKSYLEAGEVPRTLATPGHYAYLKIAEGCLKRCSYCIIPSIKGSLQSKSIDQVLKEFKALLSQGVKEIILIAQDLGDYGKEWRNGESLESLLKEIMKIEGDYWVRLMYLYPDEITSELIHLMKEEPRICPYLDMPIQHVNNTILKKMRRKTSKEEIQKTIAMLRKEVPEVVIRTSLIVGFPGETQEQFEELLEFIQEFPLDHVGVFQYSKEEGSPAATMEDHIDPLIKQNRYDKLMQAQKDVLKDTLKEQYVGKTFSVVAEEYHPDSDLLITGRFMGQAPDIDPNVIINKGQEKIEAFGERYLVTITDVLGYDLIGEVNAPIKMKISSSPLLVLN